MHKIKSAFYHQIEGWFQTQKQKMVNELIEYINIDTSTPKESDAALFLQKYLESVGAQMVSEPFHQELKSHYACSPHPLSEISENRFNYRCVLASASDTEAKRTLFNCHVDVVPATDDFARAFDGYEKDGFVYGRGACDTKNNLIMLVEAVRYMKEHAIPFRRHVLLDMPIEEEIGGNGTLSTILTRVDADEIVCLEPTSLEVFRGHRGCLTFEIEVVGRAVHMGGDATGINAIEESYNVISRLKKLEARLLENAASDPAFNDWLRPLQMNIGVINGGEWSGSVPERCIIRGDLGFLPPSRLEEVQQWIQQACQEVENEWVREKLRFRFDGLKNDACLTSGDSQIVIDMVNACKNSGLENQRMIGWNVSCDARHYEKVADKPVIIFGSGSLTDAHSAHEKVSLNELMIGIAILVSFLSAEPGKG